MNKKTYNPILKKKIRFKLNASTLIRVLADERSGFLLDSADAGHPDSGLSYFGIRPYITFRSDGNSSSTIVENETSTEVGNPLTLFRKFIEGETASLYPVNYPRKKGTAQTFDGGAVGYLSYDLGRYIEIVPNTSGDEIKVPEIYFSYYNPIISFDERAGAGWIIYNKNKPSIISSKALQKIIRDAGAAVNEAPICEEKGFDEAPIVSNFDENAYGEAVLKAKEFIRSGDIYQVNLSQRFHTRFAGDEAQLYLKLRKNNPAPFGAFLKFPEFSIMSSSPERFLRSDGVSIETRPIKGTISRGETLSKDQKNIKALSSSEKDKAEHIMIVDLERNDLGRISRTGTVKVSDLLKVESFATVHHLVSTVTGELITDLSMADIIAATFPGGSITGAPKIRSMEIIEELENIKRGIYTGSIGYIGSDGRFDLNIAIRTLIKKGDSLYFSVGGGIVADSDPQLEYEETLLKAAALLKTIKEQ